MFIVPLHEYEWLMNTEKGRVFARRVLGFSFGVDEAQEKFARRKPLWVPTPPPQIEPQEGEVG